MDELIQVYGASWCPDCRRAKRFLGDQRISFEWHDIESDPDGVDPATIGPQLVAAVRAGAGHDLLPFAGQSAELVHDVAPAAELVARLVAETADALDRAGQLAGAIRRSGRRSARG